MKLFKLEQYKGIRTMRRCQNTASVDKCADTVHSSHRARAWKPESTRINRQSIHCLTFVQDVDDFGGQQTLLESRIQATSALHMCGCRLSFVRLFFLRSINLLLSPVTTVVLLLLVFVLLGSFRGYWGKIKIAPNPCSIVFVNICSRGGVVE